MRSIETHKAKEDETLTLTITVTDEPGAGGANHRYVIGGYNPVTNDSSNVTDAEYYLGETVVVFQNGPIPEVGVNGVTQEALLAIVIDRLESFQRGPYACAENAIALGSLEVALDALKQAKRVARGVEGTREV